MTLSRQLIIFIFLLFFLLLAGTWLAKLESTRSFLIDQLESHAQDTATSLGLSISQHMADQDMPAVESMINAIFDRGYYKTIRLSDTEGHVLLERNLEVRIEDVPQWFISLIPLKTPDATAIVMAGWRQAGEIYIKSHPGYAYKTLWESALWTSIWFLVSGIIVAIIGIVVLRMLLRPLNLVEKQADALCRKKYEIQKHLPRTKELRRVVEAMNRMTSKVKEMFEEQASIAERLRKDVYLDSLTGLGNRRYFDSQITASLEKLESAANGLVLLLQINGLQELNQQKGFQAGDELVLRIGDILKELTAQTPNCILARLTGGDFGVFIPDAAAWDGDELAAAMIQRMARLAAEQLTLSDNVGHVGGVTYDSPVTPKRLLADADSALRAAQIAGPNKYEMRTITAETEKSPLGEQQWKTALEKALREKSVILYAQPVVSIEDRERIYHLEIYARILREDGQVLSANLFLPFAERLNLVSTLDRTVLEKVMRLDHARLGADTLAINLSPTSLLDETFCDWLLTALREMPKSAPRIVVEFVEFSVIQNLELVKKLSTQIRDLGHGIGLDHYGRSFSNLGYLQSLRPDYVKIDRAYTGELKSAESDSHFFISSLCSVAHSLDIDVIGEGVENEHQWQLLKELHIDAAQGYFIDKPKQIGDDGENK